MLQMYHTNMAQQSQAGPAGTRHTLVLTREAIAETMAFDDYVTAVESAFQRLAAGTVSVPAVVHIPAPGGAFHIKSAGWAGDPAYVAVKVNGNFPDNRQATGLPTIQGVITLCDGANGFPLALLDSMEVTTQRTAAATAVAAKYLADPGSRIATVIGCGIQGEVQLEALLHVLPLEQVYAFDTDQARCEAFAEQMHARTGVPVIAVADFSEGTRLSQAIVTCTSSRSAFLGTEHVKPGTFIAAVSADNDDKQELDPDLMKSAKVVVDILEQCAQIGELHHALRAGMTRSDVFADLAEVVSAAKALRASPGQTVIFDSTGSAIQDVAAAALIYERARERGLGLSVSLA
jgi:alanine dehydrogenase